MSAPVHLEEAVRSIREAAEKLQRAAAALEAGRLDGGAQQLGAGLVLARDAEQLVKLQQRNRKRVRQTDGANERGTSRVRGDGQDHKGAA